MSAAYTKLPNEVMLDATLSPTARLAFGVIRHLAWVAGRRNEEDAVELPALDVIASHVGCSRTSMQVHLRDLRRRGLITTHRVSNQGMKYVVHDSQARSESDLADRRARSKSDPELGPNLTQLPDPTYYLEKTSTKDKTLAREELVLAPPVLLVDGRNLPLDAIMDECGIDRDSPRIGQAAVALNGRGADTGIRHAFWEECRRHAATLDNGDEALASMHAEPARFSSLLAARIHVKAATYRGKFPNATLSPKALRDWWFDIEAVKANPRGQTATAAELDRLARG